MWVVGRICCDADGLLNERSLLIEGTLKYSGGSRVKLDVSRMAEFSLFPGQIVAINGLNPTGSELVALAIVGHLPQPFRNICEGWLKLLTLGADSATNDPFTNTTAPRRVMYFLGGTFMIWFNVLVTGETKGSKVLVASGPFTTTEDFSFSPLRDFLDVCKRESPTAVLLLGPYVDVEHPMLSSLDITFEDLYNDQVCTALNISRVKILGTLNATSCCH